MQLTINLPDDFFDQALAESVAKIANKSQTDDYPPFMDKKWRLSFLAAAVQLWINGFVMKICLLSK